MILFQRLLASDKLEEKLAEQYLHFKRNPEKSHPGRQLSPSGSYRNSEIESCSSGNHRTSLKY